MKPLNEMTISEMLEVAGYGHRATDETERLGGREVFSLKTGEIVGRMNAHHAYEFAEEILTH